MNSKNEIVDVTKAKNRTKSRDSLLRMYLEVFRINHWIKNVFTLVGVLLALALLKIPLTRSIILYGVLGIFINCLMSSVNYGINDFCDTPFDSSHPTKRLRPIPQGLVSKRGVLFITGFVFLLAFTLSIYVIKNKYFTLALLAFFIQGLLYNVPPVRLKDKFIIDVIDESSTNPIRLFIGWFSICHGPRWPNVSFVIFMWCFGAFLMTAKRLAEIRFLGEKLKAYRRVFHFYTPGNLFLLMVSYALVAFTLFNFLIWQFNRNLIFLGVLFLMWLLWFFKLTFEYNSIVQEPHQLKKKPVFMLYSLGLFLLMCYLIFK